MYYSLDLIKKTLQQVMLIHTIRPDISFSVAFDLENGIDILPALAGYLLI